MKPVKNAGLDPLHEFERLWFEEKTKGMSTEEIEENSESLMANLADETDALAAGLVEAYAKEAPRLLGRDRRDDGAFKRRNFRRWRPAFDLIDTMVSAATDLGQMNAEALANDGTLTATTRALCDLFPRALLVCREIVELLKSGYPDGALARWRSLHEIAVTMMFISKHGDVVALPFLVSFHFRALKRAADFNKYAKRAQLKPFSPQELGEIEQACDEAEKLIGRRLDRDYDWAVPPLKGPTFAKIEADVDMDHWRPRFAWACQHNHAGYHPASKMLGLAEAENPVHLVGMSNSGFVDPLDMTAHSLTQATVALLSQDSNFDMLIHMKTMTLLRDQVGPIAIEVERRTLENAQRRARRKAS